MKGGFLFFLSFFVYLLRYYVIEIFCFFLFVLINCFAARLRRDRLQLPILTFLSFALWERTFFTRVKKAAQKNTFKGFPLKDPLRPIAR